MVNVCSSYDMLHAKVKRNQLLVAKEKLTDLISRQGKVRMHLDFLEINKNMIMIYFMND